MLRSTSLRWLPCSPAKSDCSQQSPNQNHALQWGSALQCSVDHCTQPCGPQHPEGHFPTAARSSNLHFTSAHLRLPLITKHSFANKKAPKTNNYLLEQGREGAARCTLVDAVGFRAGIQLGFCNGKARPACSRLLFDVLHCSIAPGLHIPGASAISAATLRAHRSNSNIILARETTRQPHRFNASEETKPKRSGGSLVQRGASLALQCSPSSVSQPFRALLPPGRRLQLPW